MGMNPNHPLVRVLLVDDDREFTQLLDEYLTGAGLDVLVRHDGESALAVDESDYDVMVLDVMMPGITGIDVLRKLRARSLQPVLMLTARGDDVDRIVGLEIGADDYLAKPCNPRELLARIRAVMRRAQPREATEDETLSNGPLVLRPAARTVAVDQQDPGLTSTEFSVLEMLLRHQGRIVRKELLSEKVLGRPLGRYDRTVDMHISNLRKKLGDVGARTDLIETVRGVGYQLTAP